MAANLFRHQCVKIMALHSTVAPFDTQPVKVFEVRWFTIACHELSSMRLGDAYNRQWTGYLRMILFIIFNSLPLKAKQIVYPSVLSSKSAVALATWYIVIFITSNTFSMDVKPAIRNLLGFSIWHDVKRN